MSWLHIYGFWLQRLEMVAWHLYVLTNCIQLFAARWTAAPQASLSFTIFWSLLKFMLVESVMLSNHLILCRPLFLLPSVFRASESFPMSRLFPSDAQIIGASASASVLPMNIQAWFPLGWSGFISLQSRECSHLTQLPFILACDWWECLKSTL